MIQRLLGVLVLVSACGHVVAVGDSSTKGFDIRSETGEVVLAADQIISYDCATHTLTLKPGVRKALFEQLKFGLARGVTFAVAVGGKTVYHGVWKSTASSASSSSPVILLDPLPGLEPDQIRIDLGYPSVDFFKGTDPRGDARIETALREAGKLTKKK